jgi:ribosomal protein S18 acetylase RimI-like enzyme
VADQGRDLVTALDRADEAYFREITARTPGARVLEQDGLVLVVGTVASPVITNTILPVSNDVDIDAIRRAVAIYDEVGHHPSIQTRDHVDAALEPQLAADGWEIAIKLPGMVLESRAPDADPPAGVEIRTVATEQDRAAWLEAGLGGFASDEMDREALGSIASHLGAVTGGSIMSFYGVADDRPVATAQVFVDPESRVGVVGWVGTLPEFRRRGIGTAVTRAATNAGFDMGAEVVGLQATAAGFPIYEKLGFRTISSYKIWFRLQGA